MFKRGQKVKFLGYTDGMPSDLIGCVCKVISPRSGADKMYVKVRLVNPPRGWGDEDLYFLEEELQRVTP